VRAEQVWRFKTVEMALHFHKMGYIVTRRYDNYFYYRRNKKIVIMITVIENIIYCLHFSSSHVRVGNCCPQEQVLMENLRRKPRKLQQATNFLDVIF